MITTCSTEPNRSTTNEPTSPRLVGSLCFQPTTNRGTTIDPEVAALLEEGIPKLHRPSPEAPNWGTTPMQLSDGTLTKPSDTFQPLRVGPCRWCARPLLERERGVAGYIVDFNNHRNCPADVVQPPLWFVDRHGQIHWPESKPLRTDIGEALHAKGPLPDPRGGLLCMATLRAQIGRDHKCECAHAYDHFGFHECKRPECRRLWR